MEQTQPKIFHIHIDAQKMSPGLDDFAIHELGFTVTDFEGHPEGYDHFEPTRHLTLKLPTKEAFRSNWERLTQKLTEFPDFVGYLEGEYIPMDEYIPFKPYVDLPFPFKVTRRRLDASRDEDFRQTEFHLTMEKDQSHPDLMRKLLDSGLYGAYIPKKDGHFLVLTMQGAIKDIEPLIERVMDFVAASGGAHRCTIKEERAIAHLLQGIDTGQLPEVADCIEYL